MINRDDLVNWPTLRIRLELLPWHWRILPRLYHDDVQWWSLMRAEWICVEIEWMW